METLNQQTQNNSSDYKKIFVALGLITIILTAYNFFAAKKSDSDKNQANILNSIVQPVSAKEIYPLFLCPCCGKPLDPKNICCGMAQERIDYINSLSNEGKTKNEIILAFAKKYGVNSFVDKNKAEEFKDELITIAPESRPIISLGPLSYDFGNVSLKNGEVFTYFEIKNDGKSDLVIDRIDTSCGCTSASVVSRGQEGPRFAMAGHGINNPTNWEVVIAPGERAQLKVYYAPNVHKDFRGAAIREIYIYSNDPIDFEKKVQVELNQID